LITPCTKKDEFDSPGCTLDVITMNFFWVLSLFISSFSGEISGTVVVYWTLRN